MLTGIGRFKEMSYIFEALAEEHHFELLFRKDIEKVSSHPTVFRLTVALAVCHSFSCVALECCYL